MKKAAHITPGEFELMEILWARGEGSVKEVWQKLDPGRRLAYTTVMTVLDKMHRKGILSQRKKGKAYLYSPLIGREEALGGVLEHVLDTYFNGSRAELLRFLDRGSQSPDSSPRKVEQVPRKGEPTRFETGDGTSMDESLL